MLSSTVIVALTRMPVVLGGAAGSGRGSGAEVEGGSCSEEAPSALMAAAFCQARQTAGASGQGAPRARHPPPPQP